MTNSKNSTVSVSHANQPRQRITNVFVRFKILYGNPDLNRVRESLGNAGLSSVVIQKISDGGFVSF